MFRCLLLNSAGNICRQMSPLDTSARQLQRTLHSSSTRRQESKEQSKNFSHFPPMPGQESPLRWRGMKFEELAIAHIKATYNNTQIMVTDSSGQALIRTSCGSEGFKNSKKSTPVAAQTAGLSAGKKASKKGVEFVRVVVKGLGPGRQPAIKGLLMGGLEVVSITDNTPVPHNGCRPRKARRL